VTEIANVAIAAGGDEQIHHLAVPPQAAKCNDVMLLPAVALTSAPRS
jgi:hypothetical protein